MTLLGHIRGGQIVPDESIVLPEGASVRIELIESKPLGEWLDQDAIEWASEEGDPMVSLADVRQRMSKVQGSLSDAVALERGEY
jgi:hypothetical protein